MGDAETKTEQKLPLIGLVASFSGLLVEIVANADKTIDSLQKHFFVTLGILWGTTMILAFTLPPGRGRAARRFKWAVLIISNLLVGALLGIRYYQFYEHTKRITYPATTPRVKLPTLSFLPTVIAAEAPLTLDSFSLDESMSSFHDVQDHKFGNGPLVQSYQVDLDVHAAFLKGSCTGVYGDQPAKAAVPVLRSFWAKQSRADLAAYLATPDALGRLIRERGDIFSQIIPTPEQLKTLSSPDYEIVRAWLHDCVGLYNPVFTVTLGNTTPLDLVVTTVIYHILEVGQVMGGVGGPLYPLKTYDFTLAWRSGDQRQTLNPAFIVPAHGHASFDIRLSPGTTEHGVSWWMNLEIKDSLGHSVKSPNFDLTMNKER